MTRPKNIKLTIACLHTCEAEVKKLFFNILEDYSQRFNVQITEKPMKVSIAFVEYDENASSQGLTAMAEGSNKILIQLRDPYLSDWEDNPYTINQFVCTLCHEIVHACQHLTDRKGFRIPKLAYDKTKQDELYFFDPKEVEARSLEAPYASMYGRILYE